MTAEYRALEGPVPLSFAKRFRTLGTQYVKRYCAEAEFVGITIPEARYADPLFGRIRSITYEAVGCKHTLRLLCSGQTNNDSTQCKGMFTPNFDSPRELHRVTVSAVIGLHADHLNIDRFLHNHDYPRLCSCRYNQDGSGCNEFFCAMEQPKSDLITPTACKQYSNCSWIVDIDRLKYLQKTCSPMAGYLQGNVFTVSGLLPPKLRRGRVSDELAFCRALVGTAVAGSSRGFRATINNYFQRNPSRFPSFGNQTNQMLRARSGRDTSVAAQQVIKMWMKFLATEMHVAD